MILIDKPKLGMVYDELCQLVTELSLISHISGLNYEGKVRRDSGEDIGGGRPPGGDREPRPRRPRSPLIEGDAKSVKEWDDYEDDLAAWRTCYQRRTPSYFVRELERCETEWKLERLRDEARATLEAWRRTPIPAGQDPEYGSPQWKRWVAECPLDGGELARRFNVSRQYIYKIRRAYRTAA